MKFEDEIRSCRKCRKDGGEGADDHSAEVEFVNLLEDELEKIQFLLREKEEEYIIRLKELQDRVAKAKNRNDEIIKIRREIVDFHGEMVLLENYSALNYTGLVKILKEAHDKRTGALLRLPFIQEVLQQPFFTTDLLYSLLKECECSHSRLFPIIDASCITEEADGNEATTSGDNKSEGLLRAPKELTEIEFISLYMKSTISALRALKIRSKELNGWYFSHCPLQISGPEDTWNKIPILEQVAK
ncbi:SPX domain-containing protein 2 [Datura stramonium]|uniref:SPX domain-containing protein 2 n=1 Tax=Datura stramonium TaxID=4076 RepID=A0ABS8TB44_DATST|nr:SPX domain-containing protein 2 [Datura stramonium]